jgi:hypothetical protein
MMLYMAQVMVHKQYLCTVHKYPKLLSAPLRFLVHSLDYSAYPHNFRGCAINLGGALSKLRDALINLGGALNNFYYLCMVHKAKAYAP